MAGKRRHSATSLLGPQTMREASIVLLGVAAAVVACGDTSEFDPATDQVDPTVPTDINSTPDEDAAPPDIIAADPDDASVVDAGVAYDGATAILPDGSTPPPPPPLPNVGKTTYLFAADGSRASIAAAFAAAPATGPIVVVIPPGAWVYGDNVSFGTLRSNVTVIGSGAGATRIYRNTEEVLPMLAFAASTNVRLAELSIDGNSAASSGSKATGTRFANVLNFRVDHVSLSHHGNAGVYVDGASKGVVDHSSLLSMTKPSIGDTLGYGVVVRGIRKLENVPFGSDRATFIEDSAFSRCRHTAASNDGARYVFRHNRVSANVISHAVDAHGQEFGSLVGTEWIDVHDNVIAAPATYSLNAIRIRGGKGVIWNNTISGYTNGVSLLEDTPEPTGPVYIFGNTVSGKLLVSGAGASAVLTKPAGYVSYPYPHPLVSRVVASAGPDKTATASAAGTAMITLNANSSTVSAGAIVARRWFTKTGFLGEGATITVPMTKGTHVVVLEIERTDGATSHDTLVVRVL